MFRLAVVALVLGVTAGCMLAGTSVTGDPRTIDITRIAKVMVSPGTSKVLGTVRIPQALLTGSGATSPNELVTVSGATLRLVNEHGAAIASTQITDADGVFSFSEVPLGVSMTLEAEVPVNGKTLRLAKLIRPTEALTCAHVDLATTLLANKLLSTVPLLASDPGLEGADLYNLYMPLRLEDVESHVRTTLRQGLPTSVDDFITQLTQGDAASILNQMAQHDSKLVTDYQNIFERPDSSLVIDLTTSAVGTNSIGANARNLVFGVLTFKVTGAPEGAARIEYWAKAATQQKVAESTKTDTWEATLNSWNLPDGDYTIDTIAILGNGKKVLVGKSYLQIQNTIANFCPLP